MRDPDEGRLWSFHPRARAQKRTPSAAQLVERGPEPTMKWSRRKWLPANLEVLEAIEVLALLPKASLGELLPVARVIAYPAREELDWESDSRGPLVFGVVAGGLSVSFRSAEGKEMPVTTIPQGRIFDPGHDGWAGIDETVATAAASRTVICSLPREAFDAVTSTCPQAVMLLRSRYRQLVRELGGLTSDRLYGPESRIRHTLWRDARLRGGAAVSYTHEQLAARATTDRSRATRVIGRLQRDGLIAVNRSLHEILVLDPDRLTDDESA